MPSRPNTPCKHPGCPALVPYGTRYCETHKPLHPEEDRSAAKRGYTSRWRKARKLYLQAHPLCVHCLAEGLYEETFGTGSQTEEFLENFVKDIYDLTLKGIIENLGLLHVNDKQVSAYGHFGKDGLP